MLEHCLICNCELNKSGHYGEDTRVGRAHRSRHHHVPQRFFRRPDLGVTRTDHLFSSSARGESRDRLGSIATNVTRSCSTIQYSSRGMSRASHVLFAGKDWTKIAGRIRLFHAVIEAGLAALDHAD